MPFKNWFNRGKKDDANRASPPPAEYPWDRHPSIYEHIRAHVRPGLRGLAPGGEKLPDEPPPDPNKLSWTAGALDGVMTHHANTAPDQAAPFVRRILDYCSAPTAGNKLKAYDVAKDETLISSIDEVLDQITNAKPDGRRLYELARSFVVNSPDRGPVKVGIGILARFAVPEDLELFRTLGRHEEFTLFAAVALVTAAGDHEKELWDLAKQVDGWGRIHIVERLAKTQNPRIQDWMLRDGFRNSVMYEYLAHTCATAADLAGTLQSEHVDDELLQGAGEIIEAMIRGGPAQGIDEYTDAPAALQGYLRQMSSRAMTLSHFLSVRTIVDYLDNGDVVAWADNGWSAELRLHLREECDEILNRPQWRNLVERDLTSLDEQTFAIASLAAETLGIDTWPHHWRRLKESPTDPGRWYSVMHICNDRHIAEAIAFAEKSLPLSKLATGPSSDLGIGPEYQLHSCLDFIVQELRRFSGQGGRLIETALRSPVIRVRNMAIKALETWGKDRWPPGMFESLGQATAREPEPKVAEAMRRVLEGLPMG